MAGYIGNIPVPQGTQTRQNFTATASQTSFPTIGYTAGFIDVYLNGVKLINGTDFTASNGSDVVLASAASASDVLDVVIFDTFNTSSGTFSDTTLKNNVTLKNDTHEDSDGGRASKIIYQGEQSGGEISTLAEIQASHDGTADDQKGDLIFKTNDGSDNAAPTEAARIDSSQNLLVGKTAASGSTSGVEARSSGYLIATRDGDVPVQFRRLTNDGELIGFYNDSTQLGSISSRGGVATNVILRTATNQGAGIGGANSGVLPCDEDGLQDDEINLGASGTRWKDLYLSGGAYIGGTGAANKLEDYEEGTYTHTVTGSTSGSWTVRAGYTTLAYTKIGRLVTVTGQLETQGTKTASGNCQVSLPFAAASGQAFSTGAAFPLRNNNTSLEGTVYANLSNSQSHFILTNLNHAGTLTILTDSHLDSNWEGKLHISYMTA